MFGCCFNPAADKFTVAVPEIDEDYLNCNPF
jgi:hypothetical protein